MTEIADIDPKTAHAVRTFLAKVSGQYNYLGTIMQRTPPGYGRTPPHSATTKTQGYADWLGTRAAAC